MIIEVNNLDKKYNLKKGIGSICQNFLGFRLGRGSSHSNCGDKNPSSEDKNYFYALKNLNLKINPGETVGIIGPNGSGKSTLLKILTGITRPTNGIVGVKGSIGALLELGAGLHPELTGRQNIYFNGHIMGLTRKEMDQRADKIIQFCELGDFIDRPVKKYSSGMFIRLGFSMAINIDPDILIVDEAIAVGDLNFQLKCFNQFNRFRSQGKTILFVTHSLEYVMQYCTRGVVLYKGEKICDSTTKEAVDTYKKIMSAGNNSLSKRSTEARHNTLGVNNTQGNTQGMKEYFNPNPEMLSYGDMGVEILDYGIFDTNNVPTQKIYSPNTLTIRIKVQFNNNILNPIFAYTIKDLKGLEITGTNTLYENENKTQRVFNPGEFLTIEFEQSLALRAGGYALSLGVTSIGENGLVVHHRLYDAILFEVISLKQCVGFFDPQSKVKVIPVSSTANSSPTNKLFAEQEPQ